MLICKNCGAKLADISKKCYNCGTPVSKETTEYYDPFAEEKDTPFQEVEGSNFNAANESTQQTSTLDQQTTDTKSQNIWQQRYGKSAENQKEPTADYDWDDMNDLNQVFAHMEKEQRDFLEHPTEEQILIGPGAFRYSMKFKEMRAKNKLLGWNWGAFLMGPAWFGYRKMYLMAGITTVLYASSIFFDYNLGVIISVILDITMALFADRIYLEHIVGLNRKMDTLPQDKRVTFVRRWGGVGTWFILFWLGIAWSITYLIR